MPELPEVETVVRTLAPYVVGRRITNVDFRSALVAGGKPDELTSQLLGRQVLGLRRIGKFLVFDLDQGFLAAHLRMTGKLLWNAAPGPHTRAVLDLEGVPVLFDDIRQFGRLTWSEQLPSNIAKLGPDPLDLPAPRFAALLRGRSGSLKPLLLNQEFLSGLGNIYVDECLFRARLHPLAQAAGLSAPRVARLHSAIVAVLTEAIAAGGSSISDYVDADGHTGSFQRFHRVYGRAGEPCVECGIPIARIVVAQRGTHFCPRCQKR
jgi:formamidopyrimidine-DNA glycosylase